MKKTHNMNFYHFIIYIFLDFIGISIISILKFKNLESVFTLFGLIIVTLFLIKKIELGSQQILKYGLFLMFFTSIDYFMTFSSPHDIENNRYERIIILVVNQSSGVLYSYIVLKHISKELMNKKRSTKSAI